MFTSISFIVSSLMFKPLFDRIMSNISGMFTIEYISSGEGGVPCRLEWGISETVCTFHFTPPTGPSLQVEILCSCHHIDISNLIKLENRKKITEKKKQKTEIWKLNTENRKLKSDGFVNVPGFALLACSSCSLKSNWKQQNLVEWKWC